MASLLRAERDRSEKDFIMQPKKKKILQALTVFWNPYFPLWITHRFFKAGGFPYAVIVCLCFSGLVLAEKIHNSESRVRGPDSLVCALLRGERQDVMLVEN